MAKTKRGRPALPANQRRVHLTARVTPETKARIDRLAKLTDRSRGELLDDTFRRTDSP